MLGCSREATMTVEKSRPQLKGTDFESADGEPLKALSFRTRAAVLWLAVAIALSGSIVLFLYVPGAVEEMLGGEAEGQPLTDGTGFFMAVLVIIPVVMATMTLLMRDRVNRYVNLIVGLAYGLYGSFVVVGEIIDGHFDGHILMTVVACILAFLIAALGLIGLRQSTKHQSIST